jgi:hypothetical protein
MKWHKLISDLVRKIKWDNSVLTVKYADGKTFAHRYVPESVFLKLLSEESPGSYWLSVRDKYSDFVQVRQSSNRGVSYDGN